MLIITLVRLSFFKAVSILRWKHTPGLPNQGFLNFVYQGPCSPASQPRPEGHHTFYPEKPTLLRITSFRITYFLAIHRRLLKIIILPAENRLSYPGINQLTLNQAALFNQGR